MSVRVLVVLLLGSWITSCIPDPSTKPAEDDRLRIINGVPLFVESTGQGSGIVVVHGGPGLGAHYLKDHLDKLSDDYQLIFYDQRASGSSGYDLDSTQVRLRDFVDDIDAIRDQFGYEKVHLLAHSFGGLLALQYALSYPERLDKLILINSLSPVSAINTDANTRLASRFDAADIEQRTAIMRSESFAAGDPETFETLMKIGFKHQFFQPEKLDSLHLDLPIDFAAKSRILQYLAPDIMNFDWKDDLPQIHHEVLLAYGTFDPLTQLAMPLMAELLPNSRSVLFHESGHFPFIEEREKITTSIDQFLRGGLE